MTHYLCSNEFMILIDRKVLFPFDGPNCTRCYSCVRDCKYCGSFKILCLALQTEFVSLSMSFIKMDELVLWWVRIGLYSVVMEGSKIEFKVEEK